MPSPPPLPADPPPPWYWGAAVALALGTTAVTSIAAVQPVARRPTTAAPAPTADPTSPADVPPSPSAPSHPPTAPICRDRSGVCAPLAAFSWSRSKIAGQRVPAWSTDPASRQLTKLVESQAVALPGMGSATDVDFSPPPFATGAPLWVSLAASWCQPCKAELGDVVQAVAALRASQSSRNTHLVVTMADITTSYSLLRARTDMLAAHAKLRPEQAPLTLPPWTQFRSDLQNRWPQLLARLTARDPDAMTLPLNAVFDGCGNLWDWHSGALHPAIAARFGQRLALAAQLHAAGHLPCTGLATARLPSDQTATGAP